MVADNSTQAASSLNGIQPRVSLLKPVVQGDRGMLAELGGEAALAAKATELARSGAGNDEPVALDRVPFQRARILEQKRAAAPLDAAGDALDPDEACRAVLADRLQKADDAFALDVAAEGLGDVDLDQVRAVFDFFVGLRLVRLDLDQAGCVRLAHRAHDVLLSL